MIHIIQKFENFYAGTELHAIGLYKALSKYAECKLWCEFEPDERFDKEFTIHRIEPKKLNYPKTGTLIFVGACWYVGRWLEYSFPSKIIVIHNYDHSSYLDWDRRAQRFWHPPIDWAFMSAELRDKSGKDGFITMSPILIERDVRVVDGAKEMPVIGRLSRDDPSKFHDEDPDLYVRLANCGFKIRIMGGTHLQPKLPLHPNIEILPCGAESVDDFMESLDIFYYRTHGSYYETFGRVVFEAMAYGLPVVCGPGGFEERLKDGETAVFIRSTEDAYIKIKELIEFPEKMNLLSANSVNFIKETYKNGLPKEAYDFYLS